jgi:hypothetical protein
VQLPFGLDPGSFFAGAGFVLVLALFAFLVNVWWREATSPFRPQVLVQTTKKTPWQVVVGGLGAVLQYVGAALLVASAILILIFRFPPVEVRWLALAGLILIVLGAFFKLLAR